MNKSFSNTKLTEKARLENKRMVEEYEARNGPIKLTCIKHRDVSIIPSQHETTKARIKRQRKAKEKQK